MDAMMLLWQNDVVVLQERDDGMKFGIRVRPLMYLVRHANEQRAEEKTRPEQICRINCV